MNTTMLTRPRVCAVFNGNRKDMPGLVFPEATLCDPNESRDTEIDIAAVTLKGVNFRSPVALQPGKVHHLSAKSGGSSSLASTLRVVSCRVRVDGEFDVSAEFF